VVLDKEALVDTLAPLAVPERQAHLAQLDNLEAPDLAVKVDKEVKILVLNSQTIIKNAISFQINSLILNVHVLRKLQSLTSIR
jgi:hypothetical protein